MRFVPSLLIFMAMGAMASDQVSPYALLYSPAKGQVLSTSAVGSYQTDFSIRSPLLNDDGVSRFGLLVQELGYGLTDHTTVSVSETYAHMFERNPNNPSEGKVGFRAAKVRLTHLFKTDAITLKPTLEIQINPTISSGLNYYFLANDLILTPASTPALTLALGFKHTEYKDISGTSNTLRGEVGLDLTPFYFSMRYAESRLGALSTALGTYDPSTYRTWEAEISRQVRPNLWVGLGYLHETNRSRSLTPVVGLGNIASDYGRQHQMLTLSAKWVLGGRQ